MPDQAILRGALEFLAPQSYRHQHAHASVRPRFPSLLGRIGVKRFQISPSIRCRCQSQGPRFSSGSALRPSHDGIRRLGWNDLLYVLAVRQTAGTREPTDSPQPSSLRGTSLHQSAELGFLLVRFASVRSSGWGAGICPTELATVCPHTVHDNCHSSCHGDDRPLHSPMASDLHAPGLEP